MENTLTGDARRLTRWIPWAVLLVSLLASIPVRQSIEARARANSTFSEVLYVGNGRTLRALSLGHNGLLADIYWTRAVQYFGRKRLAGSTRFDLLGPLLDVTVDLDPQLLIAYRFGAIFLAERAPSGAGQPEQALQLLRRGIVANPDYWRFWQDLGFIYYWDLKDYKHAVSVLQVGSGRPGAPTWMKTVAARIAAEGGQLRTSALLWSEVYREAANDQLRRTAEEHLAALEAEQQIRRLNALLERYRHESGRSARSFADLVVARLLTAVPRDPHGIPYILRSDGVAALSPASRIDMRLIR